ncbi:MAG: DUF4405 domain-containing protein [Patescibacteria group bacterium]
MNQTQKNAIVDILAFFSGIVSALSGFILWIFLPCGTGQGRQIASYFLGIEKHQWQSIHVYSSIALTILVLIHLVLHWSWVKKLPKTFGK